jgi:hypothetical protein
LSYVAWFTPWATDTGCISPSSPATRTSFFHAIARRYSCTDASGIGTIARMAGSYRARSRNTGGRSLTGIGDETRSTYGNCVSLDGIHWWCGNAILRTAIDLRSGCENSCGSPRTALAHEIRARTASIRAEKASELMRILLSIRPWQVLCAGSSPVNAKRNSQSSVIGCKHAATTSKSPGM